jgi:hypothetical protein
MPVLTRTNVVDSSVEAIPTVCGHAGHQSVSAQFIWPGYTRTLEAMLPNSSDDKRSWKTFAHYKREYVPAALCRWQGAVDVHTLEGSPPRNYDYAESTNPMSWFCGEFGAAGYPISGLQLLYDPSQDDENFVPAPSGLSQLQSRSLKAMLPLIKSELSLVNSILELKDFKSLDTTMSRLDETIKSLKLITQYSSSTLRRLLHGTADGYLQTQFNLLPLFSDITAIFAAIKRLKGQLNSLIAGQGQTQKRHFASSIDIATGTLDFDTKNSPTPIGANPYGCNYNCGVTSFAKRYTYVDKAQFHAEVVYNYNFTRYQVEHAQLLGLLDAFGVNLNPAIIWNAIPWSFVVDWVLGVSRWLDDRKVLNMEPVINIQDYLWSITYRRRVLVSRALRRGVTYHDIGSDDTVFGTEGPLGTLVETAYRRQTGLPTVSSITSSGLSLKEFSLGAALVVTRGSHHKHGSR